jgi:hypothetical protein
LKIAGLGIQTPNCGPLFGVWRNINPARDWNDHPLAIRGNRRRRELRITTACAKRQKHHRSQCRSHSSPQNGTSSTTAPDTCVQNDEPNSQTPRRTNRSQSKSPRRTLNVVIQQSEQWVWPNDSFICSGSDHLSEPDCTHDPRSKFQICGYHRLQQRPRIGPCLPARSDVERKLDCSEDEIHTPQYKCSS